MQTQIDDIKADTRTHREALISFSREVNQEFRAINQEFKAVRKEMKDDFRMLFGAIVFVALGLASLLAKGFEWI